MVSVWRNVKFNTVQNLANRNKSTLLLVMYSIIDQYMKGGLHNNNLLMY